MKPRAIASPWGRCWWSQKALLWGCPGRAQSVLSTWGFTGFARVKKLCSAASVLVVAVAELEGIKRTAPGIESSIKLTQG